jgi:predicted enzyme related to lactoylglutathione lyase
MERLQQQPLVAYSASQISALATTCLFSDSVGYTLYLNGKVTDDTDRPKMNRASFTIAMTLFLILGQGCVTYGEAKKDHGMKITMTSVFVDDPVAAHKFYTEVLGFESKQFDPAGQLAVVVSAQDPNGTALLLEPRGTEWAKEYQEQVYNAGLPIIVFGAHDVASEVERLKSKGVKFRDDLARPEWGMDNLFEDTFGNFIMLLEIAKD